MIGANRNLHLHTGCTVIVRDAFLLIQARELGSRLEDSLL